MQQTESITIDRPPAEVWALVGDVRNWTKWLKDISDVELVSGELATGAEFSYKFRGRDVNATVDRYEEGRVIGIGAQEKKYDFAESLAVEPTDGGTRVTFTMGFDPTVWWVSALSILLVPFKGMMLGKPLRKELEELRIAVESEPSAPS